MVGVEEGPKVDLKRFHVLLAIGDEALHGAAIARRVSEQSGCSVTLYPAVLYPLLCRMERSGWIRPADLEDRLPKQTRWRFFALTREGRTLLYKEAASLHALATRARQVGKDGPPRP